VFVAREVLAKHDENYMPPEAAEALKQADMKGRMAKSMQDQAAAK
jgi:cytochrome c-type biogenesis protein CcmE